MLLPALVMAIVPFLAALGHWQYGADLAFQCILCGWICLLFAAALQRQAGGWLLVLSVLLLAFNPVVPPPITTDARVVTDLLASVCLGAAGIELS